MKRYADFNTVDDWLLEADDFLAHDKKSAAKNSDGDKARRAEDALKRRVRLLRVSLLKSLPMCQIWR